ncbi:hypothetical protein [Streptomyces sp. URMC 125]|uniref:hypothetical protein n=1 Tax=Streptomyces sp. URMC 125 TaxID=3423419 RepID=UPI003F19895E
MTPDAASPAPAGLPPALRGLLAAECAAEAAGQGVDPADLEQAVWLRWLERGRAQDPPSRPAEWLRAAVGRLPGRCPGVLAALFSSRDLTYPEAARELGISQGSLGPIRSRCIDCLRRMLAAEVAPPEPRGRVR